MLHGALLDGIRFYYEFIGTQVTDNTLRITAVAQFFRLLLIRIFFRLLFFLTVNVKILLCKPLLYLYRHIWCFFNFLIHQCQASRTLPIIAHFPLKLPWNSLLYFFILDFLHARFYLNALIYILNLLEDFGWNLIPTI